VLGCALGDVFSGDDDPVRCAVVAVLQAALPGGDGGRWGRGRRDRRWGKMGRDEIRRGTDRCIDGELESVPALVLEDFIAELALALRTVLHRVFVRAAEDIRG
jgi:hypothetical protein